ncbi:hypothetical protein D3C72_1267430 [compost metagenome]
MAACLLCGWVTTPSSASCMVGPALPPLSGRPTTWVTRACRGYRCWMLRAAPRSARATRTTWTPGPSRSPTPRAIRPASRSLAAPRCTARSPRSASTGVCAWSSLWATALTPGRSSRPRCARGTASPGSSASMTSMSGTASSGLTACRATRRLPNTTSSTTRSR